MNRKSLNLVVLLLVATCVLCGCAENSEPTMVFGYGIDVHHDENKVSEFVRRLNDPDFAQIEKQIRALDWRNPKRRAKISLWRSDSEQIKYLIAIGVLGASEEVPQLKVQWQIPDEDAILLRDSTSIESLDNLVELFRAAHANDAEKLEELTEWTITESEPK